MKKSTIAAIIIALVVAGGFFLAKSDLLKTGQLLGRLGYHIQVPPYTQTILIKASSGDDDRQTVTEGKETATILSELSDTGTLREAIRLADAEESPFNPAKTLKIDIGRGEIILKEPIEIRDSKVEGIIINGQGTAKTTITCSAQSFPAFIITPKEGLLNYRSEQEREEAIKANVPRNITIQNLKIKNCGQAVVVKEKVEGEIHTKAFTGEIIIRNNIIENAGNLKKGPQENDPDIEPIIIIRDGVIRVINAADPEFPPTTIPAAAIEIRPQEFMRNNPYVPQGGLGNAIVIKNNIFRDNKNGAIAVEETAMGHSFDYPIYISDNTFRDNNSRAPNSKGVIHIENTTIEGQTGRSCTGRGDNRRCSGTERRSAYGGFEINDNSFIDNSNNSPIVVKNTQGTPGIYYTEDKTIKMPENTKFITYTFGNRDLNWNEHVAFSEEHFRIINNNPITITSQQNGQIQLRINNIRSHRVNHNNNDNVLGAYHSDQAENVFTTVMQGTSATNFTKFLGTYQISEPGFYIENLNPLDGGVLGFIAHVKQDNYGEPDPQRVSLSSPLLTYVWNPQKIQSIGLSPDAIYPTGLGHEKNLPTRSNIIRNTSDPNATYKTILRQKWQQTSNGPFEILNGNELGGEGLRWDGLVNGVAPAPSGMNTIDTEAGQEFWRTAHMAFKYFIVIQRLLAGSDIVMEESEKEITVLPGVRPTNSIQSPTLSLRQLIIEKSEIDPGQECVFLPAHQTVNIEWDVVGSGQFEDSFYIIKAKKQGTNGEIIISRRKYSPGRQEYFWCGTGRVQENANPAANLEADVLQAQVQLNPVLNSAGVQFNLNEEININDRNINIREDGQTQGENIMDEALQVPTLEAGTYDIWIERYNRRPEDGGRKLETSDKTPLTVRRLDLELAAANQDEADALREEAEAARRDAEQARREAEDARRNLQALLNSMAIDYCGSILAAYADDEGLMNICIESYLQN